MAAIPWDKARYSISIEGRPVDDTIAPYLINVKVTLAEEDSADKATITLSDFIPGTVPPAPAFRLPKKGAPVTVALGTDQKGVVQQFEGFVEHARTRGARGQGRIMEIECSSIDGTSTAKAPQRKHKDDGSLKDAASEFGQAGGLSIDVHADLGSITRPFWAMDGESAIGWGRRVAREVGALFKVIGTKGVMVPKGAGISASGKPLTPIAATYGDNVIAWDLSPDMARPPHKKVRARYYDPKQAKWIKKEIDVEGGTGESVEDVRHSRADDGEAENAAKAEGTDQAHEKGGGSIDIDGDPAAQAGAPVTASGLHPDADITYKATTVTHELDRQRGYTVRLDVARPEGGGS